MSAEQLFESARAAHRTGNATEAERLYQAVLAEAPDHAHAHQLYGLLLFQSGSPERAEPMFARAATIDPANPAYLQNLAVALIQLGRHAEAIEACDRAIAVKLDYSSAYYYRGSALLKLKRGREAAENFQTALHHAPEDPALLFSLGLAEALQGRIDEAIDAYGRAVAHAPDFIEANVNLANLLVQVRRLPEALEAINRALAANDSMAGIHANRGIILSELKRPEDAMASFEAALARDPSLALAWHNLGTLYRNYKKYPEAIAAFDRALALAPDLPYLQSARLHTALYLCDWRDFDAQRDQFMQRLERGIPATPMEVFSVPTTPSAQFETARRYAADKCPPIPPMAHAGPRKPGPLRIAYVSADYIEHPVTYLLSGVLERHDRDAFEIFAISHGPDDGSAGRERIRRIADHFIDVREMDNRAAAKTLNDLDIDIAVDLGGHTKDSRPGLLAYRPARVQVNYLGYPGTMGASHIDYLIGDTIVTPREHAPYYTEKLVQLPGCYLPSTPRPSSRPEIMPTRTDCGLPDGGVVFCAFNNTYKILPQMFALWMRLLTGVPGSVLWMRSDIAAITDNLKREAVTHGVDPARLVFAPRVGAAEHFARFALADLFLDTTPYNAHTTAGDALSAGVPIVTLLGETFAGRVAASLLHAAQLSDLIAHSPAEYEAHAFELARDSVYRASIRARVSGSHAQLFDADRYVRRLEAAYRAMADRHASGLAPEAFAVDQE